MALVGSTDADTPAAVVVAKLAVDDFKADDNNNYGSHLDLLVAEVPRRRGQEEGEGGH